MNTRKDQQEKDVLVEEEKEAKANSANEQKTAETEQVKATETDAESANVEDEVEQLKQQVDEYYDQFLRAKADLENYRRRARKEKEEALKYASLSLLESLLPVLDNFERAFTTTEEEENTESFYEGMQMVYRQLWDALAKSGLEKIEAVGKPFDPHIHNAVMQEDHQEYESGMVTEEMQKGYRYHDRVVRPSMVKISN